MTENKVVTATFSLDCVPVSGTNFAFAPAAPKVGQAVIFNGSVTAGTTPITYTWNFGDGDTGSGASIAHSFPLTTQLQAYTVTLTATNACSVLPAQKMVTVYPYRVSLPIVHR